VTPVFNHSTSFISASFVIFWNINAIYKSEGLKKLPDFKILEFAKGINKTFDINSVILFSPCMVVLGSKRVASDVHDFFVIVFLELCGCCLSIFLCLRCLYHKSLTVKLLA
jgi:hypothetical protein